MTSAPPTAAIARARQHGIGDLLRRTAARYPDKLAVVNGDHRFGYAEFDAAANRAANALAGRGLAKGDLLALLSHVASREVEEAIYELDGVAEVAVFGVSHPTWIEAVTAVVVPKEGVTLTEDAVHAHAREKLAGFKRPKYVVFAEALPKNPSGKILKRDLRTQHGDLATAPRMPA